MRARLLLLSVSLAMAVSVPQTSSAGTSLASVSQVSVPGAVNLLMANYMSEPCLPEVCQSGRVIDGYVSTTVIAEKPADLSFDGRQTPYAIYQRVEAGYEQTPVVVEVLTNQLAAAPSFGKPYVRFRSCRPAVDYFFAGRWDYGRAVKVVKRESRFDPTAISRTGALGCAQLIGGIRQFLQGHSWSDPYWNVRAMYLAVNDRHWGWCHWDVVNYCAKGGEW